MAVDPEFEQAPDAPALIAGEEAHINRLAETLSRFIDGNISADALDEDLKGPQTLPTGAAPPESNMSSGSSARRSEMLSTSSTRSILTYSELTGKPAGEPIHNRDLTSSKHGTTSRFAPFRDKIDLALAQWMYHSGLSRGKVDRYFSDLRLKDLHRLTSFHNGKTWLQLLEEFNAGIANDRFTEYEIAVGVADGSGTGERYRFGFRDIIGAVRFLLGHPPFRNDLVYAPVRVFADSEDAHSNNHQRVYSEMHTADWWWETQEALPEGATVVPILLSSDKTQLSKLSGDKKAWPVYMSIGNLNHEARRQRKRPAVVLLGLLPIIPHATPELKMDAYHLALGAMTEPLRRAGERGVEIECADGRIRRCFPILAGISADYEEQVVITRIISLQHCPICHVEKDNFESLKPHGTWRLRAHEDEDARGRLQAGSDTQGYAGNRSRVGNFAWKLPHVNVHAIMMVDILHQLLKGIVGDYLCHWVRNILGIKTASGSARYQHKRPRTTAAPCPAVIALDQRFRAVPPYPGLKIFERFSAISQWTGVEYNAIIRQLMPVVTPLLPPNSKAILHAMRAILDFVCLAQYYSHTDETLAYLEDALYRIDHTKEVFRRCRKDRHFNFPKWHAMTHYPAFIRKYGVAPGYSTGVSEACHIDNVKEPFDRTNKRAGFEGQLFKHSIRHLNASAAYDVELLSAGFRHGRVEHALRSYVNTASKGVPLNHERWPVDKSQLRLIESLGLSTMYWCNVETLARGFDIPDFPFAVQQFIAILAAQPSVQAQGIAQPVTPTTVLQYPIQVHGHVKTWKPTGSKPDQPDFLEEDRCHCAPDWQGTERWRRDYVWIQEHHSDAVNNHGNPHPWNGRLVGRLLAIVTILNLGAKDKRGRYPRHTGAMVELLKYRSGGRIHPAHGMVELEEQELPQLSSVVGHASRRMYSLDCIVRSAHVVPVTGSNAKMLYLNNYIDWDQFNTLYNEDFLRQGRVTANAISKAC